MKTATYADGPTLAANNGYYSESVTSYDRNGNILGLQRMYNDTLVDNLQYIYGNNSNQIQQINDGGISNANIEDYPGSSGTYDYDANGNMIEDGSRNTDLTYNKVINLPQSIDFGNDNRLNYYYTSAGAKLLKNVIPNGENAIRTDYIGNFVYENGELAYIITGEGRFVPFGTGEERRFVPEYNIKDYLGNNRVVFMGTDLGGTIDVVQTSHYYPFGLTMKQTNSNQVSEYSKNKYLYNGKEIQDEELNGTFFGWLDYGARFYDPQIGRWSVIDVKAEKYNFSTPYGYALNNPILFIDPNGKEVIAPNTASKQLVLQTVNYMFGSNHGFSFNGNKLTNIGSMPTGLSVGQQIIYKYFNDVLVNSRSETTVKANQDLDLMETGGNSTFVQVEGSAAATTFSIDKFTSMPDPNGIAMPMEAQSLILVPEGTLNGKTNVKTEGGDRQVDATHVLMHEFGHALLNTIMNEFGGKFNGVDFNLMTEQERQDWAIQFTNTLQNSMNQETGEGQHDRTNGERPKKKLNPLNQ